MVNFDFMMNLICITESIKGVKTFFLGEFCQKMRGCISVKLAMRRRK